MHERSKSRLLESLLTEAFGGLDAETLDLIRQQLQWVTLEAGQPLMVQGERGDALFLSVSGRLRAYVRDEAGAPRMVREMGRGAVIGEISLYTDEPRTATVVAVRDSVLVRLDKQAFLALLERAPRAGLALTRQIVGRLRTEHRPVMHAVPVVQTLLPISEGVDAPDLARRLAAALQRHGKVCVVDAAQAFQAGVVLDEGADPAEQRRRASLWLSELEAEHDFVLLVADAAPSRWSQLCCRDADEVLLLARAEAEPALHANEQGCLMQAPPSDSGLAPRPEAAEILLLLHDAQSPSPRGTAAWLTRRPQRPVADHFHIRPELPRDMARLARLQARRGVGLVLAGGGARGFSHLGLMQALQAHGVEVDCVGGTSMGGMMAALVGTDQPLDRVLSVTRAAFRENPTGDLNWLPFFAPALIKGRRLRRALDGALEALLGQGAAQADLADLWKNTFVVATNYSQAREDLLAQAPLSKALRASAAIPGALPPVVLGGDLLCDGGAFNNFPVNLMRSRRGIGVVLGADLSVHKPRPIAFDELPGTWTLLRDRLRPRKQRRYKLPSLATYLLNANILYSVSRRHDAQAACDLYFNPPLERVGLLDWQQFDRIVQQGREHAEAVLAQARTQAMMPTL